MSTKEFERRTKGDRPVVAICYDFDKTLSPTDMQAQGFIQEVGYDVSRFWQETNELAEGNEMDQNAAYMFKMGREAQGKVLFTRKTLQEYGAKVELCPGVGTWFGRIRDYGERRGVVVEHYIISSGLKEMIEGTAVADQFEKIYASSFLYDERGVAVWPAQIVNYTNKTQFLFRIVKGVLDVNDSAVNNYFAPEDLRVPFRNMIYIGDSDTDIPCMKLVNSNGGHSIGVYDVQTRDRNKVYQMIHDERIKYFAPADYTEDSELDRLVKSIIDRTATNEVLEEFSARCRAEAQADLSSKDEDQRKKVDLLLELENSGSFAATHAAIEKLRTVTGWNADELEHLFRIAVSNSQVKYILKDHDVAGFYKDLLRQAGTPGDCAKLVKRILTDGDSG